MVSTEEKFISRDTALRERIDAGMSTAERKREEEEKRERRREHESKSDSNASYIAHRMNRALVSVCPVSKLTS